MAAPLTNLLRGGKKGHHQFTPEAKIAFEDLKKCFVSAPIFKMPNPTKRFIIEADASEVGVGAVLSQRHGNPTKLHPCAFFL